MSSETEQQRSEYAIDYVVMGTLDYPGLASLHARSSALEDMEGWRVDWYEDISQIAQQSEKSAKVIAPQEYYERLYSVVDLGLFVFEVKGESFGPVRVRIFVHNSILPSYQIRAQSTFRHNETESRSALRHLWQHIRAVNSGLQAVATSVRLVPEVATWTVRETLREGSPVQSEDIRSTALEFASILKDEPIVFESASLVEDDFAAFKMLDQGSEYYLIVSPNRPNDFAVSRLYYLTLAKARIKHLLDELKHVHVESVENLEQAVEKYQTVVRISPRELNRILRLRNSITKDWDAFRVRRSHVDLALGFLEFHVGRFFERVNETPLVRYTPGTVLTDRAEVELFYVQPLRDLVTRLDEDLKEALALVSSILEVFTIDVNLRLQVLNWRVQVISVAIALLSLGIALAAILR